MSPLGAVNSSTKSVFQTVHWRDYCYWFYWEKGDEIWLANSNQLLYRIGNRVHHPAADVLFKDGSTVTLFATCTLCMNPDHSSVDCVLWSHLSPT